MEDENTARLAESMSPRQREAFEAAQAAVEAEVEEGEEIDHDEPLDLTDAKVYLA